MAMSPPPLTELSLQALEKEDWPCDSLPATWLHKCNFFVDAGSGASVVGHRLQVANWVDGVPCWAAPGSIVGKLVGTAPQRVLRVRGWARDGTSTTTAFVVTDVPPTETLFSVLPAITTQCPASHGASVALIQSVMEGLQELHDLGFVLGALSPSSVFIATPPASNAVLLDPLHAILQSAPGNTIPEIDLSYKAPELSAAGTPSPTRASDLYAFGVLAWTIIHQPQSLPAERPLTVDPCFVTCAVLAGVVTACTDAEPKNRSIGGQVKLVNSTLLSNFFINNDRCLTVDSRDIGLTSQIGRGTYGAVHLGRWNGSTVAIKIVDVGASKRQDILRELSHTSSVAHPNIAEVYGWVDNGPQPWLVMKYYPQGNLEDWLRARYVEKQLQLTPAAVGGPFGLDVFFNVSIGIARALAYLASRNLVHRDVKPQNTLIDGDIPVLADFGQTRRLAQGAPQFQSRGGGTTGYAPLEVTVPGSFPLTPKADVYSLGAVMKYLLLWRPKQSGPHPHFDPPQQIGDLVRSCEQNDPKDRPDARTLLSQLEAARVALREALPK